MPLSLVSHFLTKFARTRSINLRSQDTRRSLGNGGDLARKFLLFMDLIML